MRPSGRATFAVVIQIAKAPATNVGADPDHRHAHGGATRQLVEVLAGFRVRGEQRVVENLHFIDQIANAHISCGGEPGAKLLLDKVGLLKRKAVKQAGRADADFEGVLCIFGKRFEALLEFGDLRRPVGQKGCRMVQQGDAFRDDALEILLRRLALRIILIIEQNGENGVRRRRHQV